MTWVKLDDRFMSHPKVLALGPDTAIAVTTWLAAITWCNTHLTDGHIPPGALRHLTPLDPEDAERGAGALVRVGLWELAADGWRVHDYHAYQPSRERVLHDREGRQARAKKGAAARWKGRKPKDASSNPPSNDTSSDEIMLAGAYAPPEGLSKKAPSAADGAEGAPPQASNDSMKPVGGEPDLGKRRTAARLIREAPDDGLRRRYRRSFDKEWGDLYGHGAPS